MDDPMETRETPRATRSPVGERMSQLVEYLKANPMWRWGLIVGAAGAALNILQIVVTMAAPKATSLATIFFLAPVVVYGVAGYIVAKQANQQSSGALAGMIAGAVAGLVTMIVELALILRGAKLPIPGTGRISFASAALFLLLRVVLYTAALGTVGGAVGAVFGRNRNR